MLKRKRMETKRKVLFNLSLLRPGPSICATSIVLMGSVTVSVMGQITVIGFANTMGTSDVI